MFILHNFLEAEENYAVCLKENDEIVGSIGLDFQNNLLANKNECELGYWIGKPYWNNGYATEAAKILIKHAFEDLNIRTIWCKYYENNNRSRRVQEKLGFEFHHFCDSIEVPQLHTFRGGLISFLTKDKWIY